MLSANRLRSAETTGGTDVTRRRDLESGRSAAKYNKGLIIDALADMAVELTKGTLLAYHLGRMKEEGRLRAEQVSIGKLNNTREAIAIARTSRGILGANGITLEYPIMRHLCNLETVSTYEGTHDIHTLILGQHVTGIPAYE